MSDKLPLSRQEEKVLISLAGGNLYKEIAIELKISINTVKKHLKNIYRKLEVSNRRHAAVTLLQRMSGTGQLQPNVSDSDQPQQ